MMDTAEQVADHAIAMRLFRRFLLSLHPDQRNIVLRWFNDVRDQRTIPMQDPRPTYPSHMCQNCGFDLTHGPCPYRCDLANGWQS